MLVDYTKRDSYQRIVGKVLIKGLDVNLEQINAGRVWHYKKYQSEQTTDNRIPYSDAEQDARQHKRWVTVVSVSTAVKRAEQNSPAQSRALGSHAITVTDDQHDLSCYSTALPGSVYPEVLLLVEYSCHRMREKAPNIIVQTVQRIRTSCTVGTQTVH